MIKVHYKKKKYIQCKKTINKVAFNITITINQSSICETKKFSNLALKDSTVPDCHKLTGKPFHILGPATPKDLSTKVLDLVKGNLYKTPLS